MNKEDNRNLDNVIFIGINSYKLKNSIRLSIVKVKNGISENINYSIIKDNKEIITSIKENIRIILENMDIICHDTYQLKKFLMEYSIDINNRILDSKELAAILEPWRKRYDLYYLLEKVTNLKELQIQEAEATFYVVNSMLARLWIKEESAQENSKKKKYKKSTLFSQLKNDYDIEKRWDFLEYLEKPLFYNYEKLDFVSYVAKNKESLKYNKKIKYSAYEELLRETEIWNNGNGFAYEYRKEQEKFSKKIRENIEEGKRIFIEAPTGSGKSFAYILILVLKAYINGLRGKREDSTFIISTDTKELQNQLIEKDIPNILVKLGLEDRVTYGAMKGKGNYICTERLIKYERDRMELKYILGEIFLKRLCADGNYGEIEEIAYYPHKHFDLDDILREVACRNDECNLDRCFKKCYLRKRYKELQVENITVINHSLLASWPYAEKRRITHLIIDEAHNFMEKGYDFFSEEFNSGQFIELLSSLTKKEPTIYRELSYLNSSLGFRETIEKDKLERLETEIIKNINAFLTKTIMLKLSGKEYNFRCEFYLAEDEIRNKIIELTPFISNLKESIYGMYKVLKVYFNNITLEGDEGKDEKGYLNTLAYINKLKTAFDILDAFLENTKKRGRVLEVFKDYSVFVIKNIPLNIGEIINEEMLKEVSSTTFLSATMRINNSFYKMKNQLGQRNADEFVVPQIFKLRERTRILNLSDIGRYNSDNFVKNSCKFIYKVAISTGANILVLFTNNKRRNDVLEELSDIIKGTKIEVYSSKKAIRYLKDKDRQVIILGSKGFFEGIDVPGDGLNIVMLDKLPNKSIDDPLLKAITTYENKTYKTVNYPELCIKVKQGYGRLIRSVMDFGYFCILDGGENPNTLRELERDLCGPRFIKCTTEEAIKSIDRDFLGWNKQNLNKLVSEIKGINEENISEFNMRAEKKNLFWRLEKDKQNQFILKNRNKQFRLNKKSE